MEKLVKTQVMDTSVKCQNKAPHVTLKRFQVLKVVLEMKFCTSYIKVSDFLLSQSIFSKSRLYRFRDLECKDRYNRRKVVEISLDSKKNEKECHLAMIRLVQHCRKPPLHSPRRIAWLENTSLMSQEVKKLHKTGRVYQGMPAQAGNRS